ncbi:hypothetical protein [uncultured Roseovarius sp.]|uniref:hypothetical protein n=1 Tax=uncultured Roseovarius sp. TaxID=293344 RepID=UPI00260DEF1A|nr:hypothetical protein [uncultured Roseovarius sp.]
MLSRHVIEGAAGLYYERRIKGHIGCAVDLAIEAGMVPALGEALCAALDTICADMPAPSHFQCIRHDAEYWADIAHPREIEAYVAAGLRAASDRVLSPRASKRLFVTLWDAMPVDDRKRFLFRLDPEGKFLRGVK